MKIVRQWIPGQGYKIPCAAVVPPNPRGQALVVHGYGGCKEEQLGLAWRMAEDGIAACAMDLRGHGEHPRQLDDHALEDLESALSYLRKNGPVAIVGHSFGARLALHCG